MPLREHRPRTGVHSHTCPPRPPVCTCALSSCCVPGREAGHSDSRVLPPRAPRELGVGVPPVPPSEQRPAPRKPLPGSHTCSRSSAPVPIHAAAPARSSLPTLNSGSGLGPPGRPRAPSLMPQNLQGPRAEPLCAPRPHAQWWMLGAGTGPRPGRSSVLGQHVAGGGAVSRWVSPWVRGRPAAQPWDPKGVCPGSPALQRSCDVAGVQIAGPEMGRGE